MLCKSINLHDSVHSYRMCYPGHLVGIVYIMHVTLSTCRLDIDSLQLIMDVVLTLLVNISICWSFILAIMFEHFSRVSSKQCHTLL